MIGNDMKKCKNYFKALAGVEFRYFFIRIMLLLEINKNPSKKGQKKGRIGSARIRTSEQQNIDFIDGRLSPLSHGGMLRIEQYFTFLN